MSARGTVVTLGGISLALVCGCGSSPGAAATGADASTDATTGSDANGSSSGGDDAPGDSADEPDVLSVTPPTDDADTPPSPDAGPGGPWIAFTSTRSGSFDLYLVHPDGTGLRPVVQMPGSNLHPAWSPDGARIAFTSDSAGLYVVDVASGAITAVATTGLAIASNGSYSPDAGELALGGTAAGGDAGGLIYSVPVAGGTPTPLTSGSSATRDGAPVWSPDGSVIYFASARSGPFEVWSVAPDGTALTQVTTGSNIIGGPAISPDGRSLLFCQGGSAVVLYSLATKTTTVVSSMGDSSPSMSPDGTRIAMTSTRYGASNPEIVVTDLDGGSPFRLTNDPGIDDEAVFQPQP